MFYSKMNLWTILVLSTLVVICGSDVTEVPVLAKLRPHNETAFEDSSGSKMEWLVGLLDHHDWEETLNRTSKMKQECALDLKTYIQALNKGQLWASKMYDASGHYNPNMLFGNEYWLGSKMACRDLQLTQYYDQVPPFATAFHVARVNLTIHDGHIPQSRGMLVGLCMPARCSQADLTSLLEESARQHETRGRSSGISTELLVLAVRPVPGDYNILYDPKFHIIASVTLVMVCVMSAASLYEAHLERQWRASAAERRRDLELSQHNNNNNTNNKNVPVEDTADTESQSQEPWMRRETCGLLSELLLSFSIISNGRVLLNTDRPADASMMCLHGMRFLSVIWVVMVHTYLTLFYIADNKTMRTLVERNFFYQSVGNASYSVDTFFFISGLLLTILYLKSKDAKDKRMEKKNEDVKSKNGYVNPALSVSVISQASFGDDNTEDPKRPLITKQELMYNFRKFIVLFFYRVARLTPAYAFVIGIDELALRYSHNYSVFEPAIFDHITCDKYWWRNVMYINNLFPQREMCMVWSWYMANDVQFYVVGIILLLISARHMKFSLISAGVIMLSSWVTTIYISWYYQYKARIQDPFEMFDPLYDKPWSRIGPYLIGMLVGWYLYKTKCQVKIPKWLVVIGWPVALLILGSLIFSMVDGYFEVWPTAFYVSVGHTGWAVALAWVTIACCCGYGGLVNSALSYRGMLPLSRLTYCAYLIHPTIMMYTSFLMDGPIHLENSLVLVIYAGYAVMSFLSSFAISLAFEAPVVRILKVFNSRPS